MKTPRGTARKLRRQAQFIGYVDPHFAERNSRPGYVNGQHVWEDGVCVNCGFDGAEWSWWKHQTYEGKASDQPMPRCETRS